MSKIGNVAMELDEQAAELGFESLQQALDAGCEVEYGSGGNSELVEPLVAAHRAWEAEKKKVLEGLDYLLRGYPYSIEDAEKIADAIKFVESCHE